MPDDDAELERRLAAVERALDANDVDPAPAREHSDGDDLESRVVELESRVDELDAAVQAVRGFLGGVSAVNESVERRADAAVATVERLERRLDDRDRDRADHTASGDGGTVFDLPDADSETAVDGQSSADDGCHDRGLRERLRGLR
jgi:hypothetical protein